MKTAEDKMDDKIAKAIKGEVLVIYSAYETDENDEPIDNLDEIAAIGKIILVCKRCEFYGGDGSKNYRSDVLENPTWLQVAVCANEMIKVTRDEHHVFLEGLYKKRTRNGITTYELAMGS